MAVCLLVDLREDIFKHTTSVVQCRKNNELNTEKGGRPILLYIVYLFCFVCCYYFWQFLKNKYEISSL